MPHQAVHDLECFADQILHLFDEQAAHQPELLQYEYLLHFQACLQKVASDKWDMSISHLNPDPTW
jgi:hypothetical protein